MWPVLEKSRIQLLSRMQLNRITLSWFFETCYDLLLLGAIDLRVRTRPRSEVCCVPMMLA